jgi:hypothetical protein
MILTGQLAGMNSCLQDGHHQGSRPSIIPFCNDRCCCSAEVQLLNWKHWTSTSDKQTNKNAYNQAGFGRVGA